MEAAGAYLEMLRKRSGLSRARLAAKTGLTENTIWRIESGRQQPEVPTINALVEALDASREDFDQLLQDHGATKDDGERLAIALLEGMEMARIDVAQSIKPDEKGMFLRHLEEELDAMSPGHQRQVMALIRAMLSGFHLASVDSVEPPDDIPRSEH